MFFTPSHSHFASVSRNLFGKENEPSSLGDILKKGGCSNLYKLSRDIFKDPTFENEIAEGRLDKAINFARRMVGNQINVENIQENENNVENIQENENFAMDVPLDDYQPQETDDQNSDVPNTMQLRSQKETQLINLPDDKIKWEFVKEIPSSWEEDTYRLIGNKEAFEVFVGKQKEKQMEDDFSAHLKIDDNHITRAVKGINVNATIMLYGKFLIFNFFI